MLVLTVIQVYRWVGPYNRTRRSNDEFAGNHEKMVFTCVLSIPELSAGLDGQQPGSGAFDCCKHVA
jgi:hypothetical protein